MRERHLHGYGALGRSNIHESFVITPGEFSGNGPRRRQAETGHGGEEEAEADRVGVDRVKKVLAAFDLVLRLARAQAMGERAPERIQSGVGHLQHASDVRRLGAVQVQVGVGSVRVLAVVTLEHPERHESVKEIQGAARMQSEPLGELLRVQRAAREFGEETQLNRAQQRL